MQKIVFYQNKPGIKIGGLATQYLEYGSYLAKNKKFDVYIVDYIRPNEVAPYLDSGIHLIDVRDFDASGFEGSIFVVTLNQIFRLLSQIVSIDNAKLLVWTTHPRIVDWTQAQFRDLNLEIDEMLQAIHDKDALWHMDGANRIACDRHLREETEGRILPISLREVTENKVTPAKALVDEEVINIAWLGRLDTDKYQSLQNLCNNLKYSNIDKSINLHVIGDGDAMRKINWANWSPQITFILKGPMFGTERDEYLSHNCDFVVAMGVSSVNTTLAGLPSFIPPVSAGNVPFFTDQYVLLRDVENASLGWEPEDTLLNCKMFFHIKEIIDLIYGNSENSCKIKSEMVSSSLNIARSLFDLEKNAEILIDAVNETKLTLENLRSDRTVRGVLSDFTSYCRNNELEIDNFNSFPKYQKFVHQKRILQFKKGFGKVEYSLRQRYKRARKSVNASLKNRENKRVLKLAYKNHERVKKLIATKVANGCKIKVGFLIIFSGVFPLKPLFEKMLEDKAFDPKIVIIPNVTRSQAYTLETFNEAWKEYSKDYSEYMISGYDEISGKAIDIDGMFDILAFNNPYKRIVDPLHFIENFADKDVLTIHANYGYPTVKFWEKTVISLFYGLVWRTFLENDMNLEVARTEGIGSNDRYLLSGYMKMDKLATYPKNKGTRKKVLVCFHHSVPGVNAELQSSTFLENGKFFLELAEGFTSVDFVFRPHPLLFDNLKDSGIWTQAMINEYKEELERLPNVLLDDSSDYLKQFASSDAMIHDCCSFIGEYLFTDNPCCYMAADQNAIENRLLPFGLECLEHYYKAFDHQQIVDFIEDVVLGGNDPLKDDRVEFVENTLKVNYPNVSQFVLDHIKSELGIK